MSNKKTYSIEINGLKQSISDVETLSDVMKTLDTTTEELTKEEKLREAQLDKLTKLQFELNNYNAEYAKQLQSTKTEISNLNKITKQQVDLENAMNIVAEKNLTSYYEKQKYLTSLGKVIKSYNASTEEEIQHLNQLKEEYFNLNTELKDFDKELNNHQRNVGNYPQDLEKVERALGEVGNGFVDVMADIGKLEDEFYSLRSQGLDPSSDQMQALAQRITYLKNVVMDTDGEIDRMTMRFRGLNDVVNVARTGVAVFGLWEGAMGALGIESEEFEQTMRRVTGIMTLMNSLQEIQATLTDRTSIVYQVLNKTMGVFGKTLDDVNDGLSSTTNANTFNKSFDDTGKSIQGINNGLDDFTNKALLAADATNEAFQTEQISKYTNEIKDLNTQILTINKNIKENTRDDALSSLGIERDEIISVGDAIEEVNKKIKGLSEDLILEDGTNLGIDEKSLGKANDQLKQLNIYQEKGVKNVRATISQYELLDDTIVELTDSTKKTDVATQAATKSTFAWGSALKAIGVGLGIGLLITLLTSAYDWIKKLNEQKSPFKKLSDDLEKTNEEVDDLIKRLSQLRDVRVAIGVEDLSLLETDIRDAQRIIDESNLKLGVESNAAVELELLKKELENVSDSFSGYSNEISGQMLRIESNIKTVRGESKKLSNEQQANAKITSILLGENFTDYENIEGVIKKLNNSTSYEDQVKTLEKYLETTKDVKEVESEAIEQRIRLLNQNIQAQERLRQGELDRLEFIREQAEEELQSNKDNNEARLAEMEVFNKEFVNRQIEVNKQILDEQKADILELETLNNTSLNRKLAKLKQNYAEQEKLIKQSQGIEVTNLEAEIAELDFANGLKLNLTDDFIEEYNNRIELSRKEELEIYKNSDQEVLDAINKNYDARLIATNENGEAVVNREQYKNIALKNLNDKHNKEIEGSEREHQRELEQITKDGGEAILAEQQRIAEEQQKIIEETQNNNLKGAEEFAKISTKQLSDFNKTISDLGNVEIKSTSIDGFGTWVNTMFNSENLNKAKETIEDRLSDLMPDSDFMKNLTQSRELELTLIGDESSDAWKAAVERHKEEDENLLDNKKELQKGLEDVNEQITENNLSMLDNFATGVQFISSTITSFIDLAVQQMEYEIEVMERNLEIITDAYDKAADDVTQSEDRIMSLNEQIANSYGERQQELKAALLDEERLLQERQLAEQQLAEEKAAQEEQIAIAEEEMRKKELQGELIGAIANVAAGVASALSAGIVGIPFAAIIAAMGAIEVGVISSQISKLADGGLLEGASHSQGGITGTGSFNNIEVEGGEYVINKRSTAKYLPLIEEINNDSLQVGMMPNSKDGEYFNNSKNLLNNNNSDYLLSELNSKFDNINFQPVVSVEQFTKVQNGLTTVKQYAGKRG